MRTPDIFFYQGVLKNGNDPIAWVICCSITRRVETPSMPPDLQGLRIGIQKITNVEDHWPLKTAATSSTQIMTENLDVQKEIKTLEFRRSNIEILFHHGPVSTASRTRPAKTKIASLRRSVIERTGENRIFIWSGLKFYLAAGNAVSGFIFVEVFLEITVEDEIFSFPSQSNELEKDE